MDLFRPYEELEKLLLFKDNGDCYIGVEFFGTCGEYAAGAASEDFIKKVQSVLKRESSTVTLKTACGCSRRVDISDKAFLRGYYVDIIGSLYSFKLSVDNAPLPLDSTYSKREFKWRGRYSEDGFKLLEEVL